MENRQKNYGSVHDTKASMMYNRFLKQYNDWLSGGPIPDTGNQDTKYFLGRGFKAEAVDGSEELVKIAAEYTGANVRQMFFQDLNENETYDGIWACSSILHLTYSELAEVFVKMARALVPHGILYTSFKYGTDERERNGRYFTDMTEDKMKGLLDTVDVFSVEDMWVTSDVRPGRDEEKWLNMILRKK